MKLDIWKKIPKEFKDRWTTGNRLKGLALSAAAVSVIIVSASELWHTNQESIFNQISSARLNWIIPSSLWILLFILYAIDYSQYDRISKMKTFSLGAISAFLDAFIVYSYSFCFYALLFSLEFTFLGYIMQWNLFYLALPVIIGEFTLSERASSQLEKARRLHEEASELLKEIREEKKRRTEKRRKRGKRPQLSNVDDLD